jgi:hypothetical protein
MVGGKLEGKVKSEKGKVKGGREEGTEPLCVLSQRSKEAKKQRVRSAGLLVGGWALRKRLYALLTPTMRIQKIF